MKFRLVALLSLLAMASVLLTFSTNASARLRILSPSRATASKPVRFAAATGRRAEKVAFYVDGRRRWVDDSPGWRFGRNGHVVLDSGRHVLSVQAVEAGRVVRSSKSIDVVASTDPTTGAAGGDEPAEGAEAFEAGAREASPSSDLLFSGSRISDFADNQSAPGAVSEVPDPAGGPGKVLKMTVENDDVAPITPTKDPRAQLLTPAFVHPGEETWWRTSFYLPKDFPSYVPGWVSVIEGPYGPPYDGSPEVSIGVNDNEIRFQRGDVYDYDIAWQQPIERGRWIEVLFHTRFGRDGFVELWVDGQRVTFFEDTPFNPLHEAPTSHLEMQTMDHTNDGGPNFFVLQNYREHDMFGSLTLYHGPTAVGTTRASVEG